MEFTYKGLQGTLQKHIVTADEVESQLHKLLQQTPRIQEVNDRPAQVGDEVILDYAGFCDGEQFPGGTAEKQALTLGSGMFIPGFEEQLIDKVPGETVIVKVAFPKEYHAENLAGKDAEFHCVIHAIRIKTAYELDDVFAKEVGDCETLSEMKEKLRQSLQDYADQRGEMELQEDLLRQAANTLDYTPSDEELEKAVQWHIENLEAQLARQGGLSLEMYCSFLKTTPEELRKDIVPTAKIALRNQAAVDKIIELENLEADQNEIAQALAVICRQNNLTMEQMKPHYDAAFEQAVTKNVLTSKAMRLIRDAAVVEEK